MRLKHFLSVFLTLLTLSVGQMWGTTSTLTLSSTNKFGTSSGSTMKSSDNAVTWTVTTSTGSINGSWSAKKSGNTNGYSGEQFGTTSTPWTGTFSTTIPNKKITSVVITANTGQAATLNVSVGGTDFTPKDQSVTKRLGENPYTYTFSGEETGEVIISVSSTTKAFYLGAISITYENAASCTTNPTVTAGSNSSVTSTTATVSCSGGITSLGSAGCSITSYGFVIGSSSNPAIGGTGVTKHEVGTSYTTTGTSFSKNLTGLSASTTYYVRPYATNGKGTAYGTQTSFTTLELAKYTVQFSTGEGNPTRSDLTEASAGAGVTLPTAVVPHCSGDGWSFAGWKETSAVSSETTNAPTLLAAGSTYHPTSNCTLYAVYKKTGDEVTTKTIDLVANDGTYDTDHLTFSALDGTLTLTQIQGTTNTAVNSTYSKKGTNTNRPRVYKGQSLKIESTNYAITKVEITANSTSYGNDITAATSINNDGSVTDDTDAITKTMDYTSGGTHSFAVEDEDGVYGVYIQNTAATTNTQLHLKSVVVSYLEAAIYYLSAPDCCSTLGQINGSFTVNQNVEVDGTDITVSLVAANLVEGAAGYRFVLYDNAATPTKITSKDINETSNVSCTFGSSDGITVGTTYKVSVITLGDGSTNCAVGGESSKIAVEVPNLSVWTVSYNKNTEDEVTGMPSGTQILQTVGTGNLSNDTPARTGYTFVGWSDASGDNTKNYDKGGSITITGDKTVYAVWTATNYSVSMAKSPASAASDEAVVISGDQSNKHYNDPITVSVTAHPGYVFDGWTASPTVTFANENAESTTFDMPASDVTVTAKFIKVLTVAEARDVIDGNDESAKQGVYVKGIVSGIVTAYNDQYGNISYNLSYDGLTTSDQLQAFRGKSYNGDWFTSADDIQVGDEVVVHGDITYFDKSSLYEFAADNQLYSLKRLTSISVKTAPTKVTYNANEHFDPTGLVITLNYTKTDGSGANNVSEDVAYNNTTAAGFTFSPTTSADLNATNTAVTITYKGKSVDQAITVNRIATTLGWSAASYEATQGDNYSFPTLTTITPAAIASGVTYSSTNANVATINASGVITVKTHGTTTIKADFAQTNIYAAAATASYTLTILEDMTPRLVVDPNSLTFSATPKDDSANETFNLVGTHLTANATLAITSATEGDAAMFSVTESVAKDGSGAINSNVTVTYTPTAVGSHAATLTISSTGAADVTVALSGTALETDIYKSALHTDVLAWSDYDEGKKMAGNSYSVPNPGSVDKGSDNCAGNHYRFAGWVEDNYKEAPTGHIDAASGTKNASGKVYWAVWEKETASGPDTYQMTTSVAVGDVVVIAEIDHKADGKVGKELSGINTSGNNHYGNGEDFATLPNNGTMEWTVVTGYNSTGVAFQNNSNYLYWGSGNTLDVNATLSANTSWTVTTDSERAKIVNTQLDGTDSRILCWNEGSPRFAAYKNKNHGDIVQQNQDPKYYYPVFYKKVPGVVYGDPITYCCTPHDITISNSIEHGTVEADLASACAGTEITLSITPSEGYEFESLTVAGEDVTTGVVENEYSFDMIDDDVVVSATFNKIAVTGVTINGYSSVAKGANITLTLEITPSTARPTVVWTSSNNEIATVANGVVTGVAQGSVTITATVDGTDYTKDITVTRETKLNSITVVSPKTAYTLNEEFVAPRVNANYLYVDDESEAPTLENIEGATFGGFDNQHAGEQTITVSYGGKTTTYDVAVSAWTLNLQTKSQTGPATVTPATTQVTIDTYGSEINLKDYYVENLCNEYTQVGFIASSTDVDSDSEPENLLTAYTPTADNETLYAVFSHVGYEGQVLVDEDFSLFTESSNSAEISADDFDWMYAKSKAYPEVGYVKLGSSNYAGYITTIELDLRHKFKVSLDAKKYGTDGGNITITADETDWTNEDALTDAFASIEHEFNAVGKDKQITIETTSKRAYIDNIKIETLDETTYTSVYDCRSDMTVTYAIATADAEAGATGACEQETVKQGNDYTVCTNEPTWAGHEFAGWSDGVSIVGATIENVQDPITLTATWNEIEANTITISSDAITAGTMTLDDGRTATLTVTFDPTDTYNKTLTWSEDSHYTITDNGDGTYQIQAKDVTAGITVTATTANSKSASFSLVVNAATKLTGLTLEGLTEANTVYTIGDAFSTTGIVVNTTVNMGDAPENVEADFSTPDMTSAGVKTVTVEYTHPEYGYASTTYEITVNAKYVHLYRNEALIETRTLNSTAESVTLPDGDNATWAPKVAGYSLIGFADAANAQYPKVAAGASYVPSVQEISLYALYTNVAPTYTLISSAEELVIGRSIIIATKDAASDSKHYAIGELNFTQAGVNNNRKGTEVTKSGDGNTLTAYAGATEFILMAGKNTDTYALYDPINGKYVCATTTNNNYLRLEETLSAEGSWTITPNSVISATTTGNNKHLRFNYNGGNPTLFSCYAENKQAAIAVYQSNVEVEYDPTMEMEVTTAQTLNTADVDESVNVIVKNGGELTIGSELEINNIIVEDGGKIIISQNMEANDMIVENGGKVEIAEDKKIDVKDFYIGGTHGRSGQVTNAKKLDINGDAYFDFTLGVDISTNAEKAAAQWHNFSVPFNVDAINGVYGYKEGEWKKLTNEVDYAIEYYHGNLRANGEYGWKKFRGTMTPGHTYSMTVNGDIQTYRFKKLGNDAFVAAPTVGFSEHASGTTTNAGWNGLGNMRLCYSSINNTNIAVTTPEGKSAGRYVLVLDAETYNYVAYLLTNINLTVGSAFFIQASGDGTMGFNEAQNGAGKIYAPARTQGKVAEPIMVTISGERGTDHMYISADEDATSTYQIGRDMQRMFASSNPTTPLIYTMNYGGLKLAAEDAPMVNDKAVYTLQLYAPIAGEYTLKTEAVVDADVYLTYEGAILWNISESEYTVDLSKGKTDGYGLLLQKKAPQTPTGVEQSEVSHQPSDIQKIIINDNVFILRGGQMYDVTGKAVK